jgi:hypothetical protein
MNEIHPVMHFFTYFIGTFCCGLLGLAIFDFATRRFLHIKWFCNKMGWHYVKGGPTSFDGCSAHATCNRCKKEVMQDSQGNWF